MTIETGNRIAERLNLKWNLNGKLPYNNTRYSYSKIECELTLDKTVRFFYTNEWDRHYGDQDNDFLTFYGPFLELKDIWPDLTEDEKTEIMASVLGGK